MSSSDNEEDETMKAAADMVNEIKSAKDLKCLQARIDAETGGPPPSDAKIEPKEEEKHLNDRLAESDPDLVRLDITSSSLFDYSHWEKEDFISALQQNRSVTHVHLSGDGLEDVFTPDQIDLLVEGIGYLENLEEFFVFKGGNPYITGKRIGHTIQLSKKLRVFMLWGFDKIEEENDLAGAIRQSNLERVTITLPVQMNYACLDVFIMGLASMRRLKCLCIRCKHSQPDAIISPEAIPLIFASRSLKSLYLENCGLVDDHSDAIAGELPNNRTLALLDLKHNSFSDDALYAFAQKIPRCNRALTSIDLSGVYITEGGVMALAEAMKENTFIKNLELEGTATRFADEFDIPDGHNNTDYMQALHFRLRLNRAGKGENREKFAESLNSVSDHLDCIYYLVRRNAHYCERPELQMQRAREDAEKQRRRA